ncbi:MAG: undecaprenyl-phosphate glucose phosphotransferase [Chloroflexota bacterium]|nr:undecaprenyl-phosphate glucose phosphotransferase [Dehalococcoidia bacterium]MDW8255021.1 undecaprenyl-phosphate glucose phosphotransferase [Chloroflexota bacterium]
MVGLATPPATDPSPDFPAEPARRPAIPRSRPLLALLVLLGDVTAAFLAVVLAYRIRFESGWISVIAIHPWEPYLAFAVIFAAIVPLVFAFSKLYRLTKSASRIDELYKIFGAASIALLLSLAVSVLTYRDFDYSRAILPIVWILAIGLIWTQRLAQYWVHGLLRSRGVGTERLLVIGDGEIAATLIQKAAASRRLGYQTVGVLSRTLPPGALVAGAPVLGTPEEVARVIRAHQVHEVIIADPEMSHREILDIVGRSERENVNIRVFPDIFQIIASEVSIGDFEGMPLVSVRDAQLRGWNLAVKRFVDIVISAAVLILLSPFMLLTALLIKLTSGNGPVFYTQERVGLDGKPFMMIKFRSMRPDAEAETGPVWAQANDPRRTPLGRFLRRFSLDELPQFINVLLGDMSIVGPRPERPHFVQEFSQRVPRYLDRHREKAGITGWAQVNGLRGNTSIEERTAYDLWYVENWTLWLDFKIMLRTLISIITDKNAY